VAATTSDMIERRAFELAGTGDAGNHDGAVAALVEAAGGDRAALEEARNRVARRLHGHAGDWPATAALGLLNRALVSTGWSDPYDWRIRWSQPFRRP
jgi:hypothetical protein